MGCSAREGFDFAADFVLKLDDAVCVSRILYEIRCMSCAVCVVWIRRFSSFASFFLLVVRFRFNIVDVWMLEAAGSAVRKLVELCGCCQLWSC